MNSLKTSNDLDLKKVVAFSLKSNQCSMYENSMCCYLLKMHQLFINSYSDSCQTLVDCFVIQSTKFCKIVKTVYQNLKSVFNDFLKLC